MVMTFILHPLSHYSSVTEPHAQFLLSFLEEISFDFLSHFILSLINVYRDTTTHDKLIFPLAMMWILRHFSFLIPDSLHYIVMGAITTTSIWRSEAQL